MASAKMIAAIEQLLAVAKEDDSVDTPVSLDIAPDNNRTPAVTDYEGGDVVQDVIDCLRRAVRVSREGGTLSKKVRNVMRDAIKNAKEEFPSVLNTNGNDFLTQNGV